MIDRTLYSQPERRMLVVDSQLHPWEADRPDRPWPPGRAAEAHRPYPMSAESLLFQMDTAGVDRAVLVPPSWEGDRNEVALDAAARYPERFAVMGRLDPRDPGNRDRVAGWKRQAGMLGMRFTFHNEHNRFLLTEGHMDWLWQAAEAADVPVMMLAPAEPGLVDRVAARHPGLRIVVDHAGVDITRRAPEVFGPLPGIAALAAHPRVAIKLTGMPSLSTQGFPYPDLHDGMRRLFDAFGPRRTFWGTDLTRMPCSYYECVHLFTDHLPWLSGEDRDWVMGRGVCEWLGWPLPA